MTEEMLARLASMQDKLQEVIATAELHGRLADGVDAKGFALAAFMLREALIVYSRELEIFVREHIDV